MGTGRWSARSYRGGSRRCIAALAAAVEVALVASVGALAHGGSPTLIAAQAVATPAIDGVVRPANEWADAASLSVPFPGHPARLTVKHDDTYLYVLLSVQDDRPSGGIQCCPTTIYFDNNHNGVTNPGEDAMGFGPAEQTSDQFLVVDQTGLQHYTDDRTGGGTVDTVAGGSYDTAAGRLILEARKPLCSADAARDFCVQAGATLGFTVDYFSSAGTTFDYPAAAEDFARFGDLRISPAPAADLTVKVVADAGSVRAGDSVTFTTTTTNNGPGSAADVVLDLAFEPSGGVAAIVPKEICGCELGALRPGESTTTRKTVKLTSVPARGGTISLGATVADAETADPDATNSADALTVDVTGAPAVGETVNASRSAGVVSVRSPGTAGFVPLRAGQSIPVGSEVNASKGQVRITTGTPSGKLQTATASAGVFRVTQPKRSALTTLRLTAPIRQCPPGRGVTVLRRLSVNANDKFRTVGARAYAKGRSRKASWVIFDRCVPVRRSLAAAGKPKRKLQTCISPGPANPSKHTQADLYDPAGHKQKGNCTPLP